MNETYKKKMRNFKIQVVCGLIIGAGAYLGLTFDVMRKMDAYQRFMEPKPEKPAIMQTYETLENVGRNLVWDAERYQVARSTITSRSEEPHKETQAVTYLDNKIKELLQEHEIFSQALSVMNENIVDETQAYEQAVTEYEENKEAFHEKNDQEYLQAVKKMALGAIGLIATLPVARARRTYIEKNYNQENETGSE